METETTAEDSSNKENRNDSRDFVVLRAQLAFFHGSQTRQVIRNSWYSEIFLQWIRSFINYACFVNMAGYKPRPLRKRSPANIQLSWPHAWLITHVTWCVALVFWKRNQGWKSVEMLATATIFPFHDLFSWICWSQGIVEFIAQESYGQIKHKIINDRKLSAKGGPVHCVS